MTEALLDKAAKGLDGVVAGETAVSLVDGVNSRLIFRGFPIAELAGKATFEETAYLIWNGNLPNASQLKAFKASLAKNRALPKEIMRLIRSFPKKAHPMDVLRTATSALSMSDPDKGDNSIEANQHKSVRLLARMGSIVATFERTRRGKSPLAPKPRLSHAGNILYMMTGKEPESVAEKCLDVYLVLLADHGFNASTFTARVIVSTLSDIYSGVTGAIGALKGSLHGGANEKAMEMLMEIGKPEKAEKYIRDILAGHGRVMGFGHRVYKGRDPRTQPLKEMSRQLADQDGHKKWYDISEIIEKIMEQEKNLYCNVDLYSASVLYSIGIPVDTFTPLFAVSRVCGWTAHIIEQLNDNRLIRPKSNYTGEENRTFVPISER